jgi:hemerythrin-like domain-containing protein
MIKLKLSPAAALAEAHRALLGDLAGVEDLARPGTEVEPAEVRRRLETLRGHLGKHFRFEEESGYMQAVLARAPHQERRVRRLREEHNEMWTALADLVRQATTLPALTDEFRQELRAWVERARDHEERENLLVEDTFNTEVAAGD